LVEEHLKKEARRAKNKNRKRLPLRAAITPEDYNIVMEQAKSIKPLSRASDKIAICLLFLTGLRISNLKEIKVGELKRFLKGHDLVVSLIKTSTGSSAVYPYNKSYAYYFRRLRKDFIVFFKNKRDSSKPAWPIARETLTRRINKILKRASIILEKNLKSHSFRIGIATAVPEDYTLQKAQQVLGHANIATTQKYARGTLKKREKAKILARVTAPIAVQKSKQINKEGQPNKNKIKSLQKKGIHFKKLKLKQNKELKLKFKKLKK
jgi:site-specific recombinase XerD